MVLRCTSIFALIAFALAQVPPPTPPVLDRSRSSARLVQTDAAAGLELWETKLGRFWVPKPGEWVIPHLELEQTEEKVYDVREAHVQAGDIVLDCGAHIGFFTRVALRAGARLVIAVEPDIANIAAFKRNFAQELRSGTVRLVPKGVWSGTARLTLQLSTKSNDSHSLYFNKETGAKEQIDVTSVDAIVRDLHLERIDFIKMDIEGAETHALQGALTTLKRWRPRLAISAYHLKDDPANIAKAVWDCRPDYRITSKDVVNSTQGIVPKVLFFF